MPLASLFAWFDTSSTNPASHSPDRVDVLRILPFVGLHLGCLAVLWVGWSPVAVAVAAAAYGVRMFAVTAFYHRYFSHRAFSTSRAAQFLFALLGASAVQRGPLWWAAHHRRHHRHSDGPDDPHSPRHGFLWSHMLWFTTRRNFATDVEAVPDLARYPELRFLDRFDILVPLLFAAATGVLGGFLQAQGFDTSPAQMLVWAFFISTVVLFHATCTINSLAHRVGTRRYETDDDSRNSLALALITLGEGWHNNHHRYPGAVRQGFYWWEVDVTYYILALMAAVGLVRDLHPVPVRVYREEGS